MQNGHHPLPLNEVQLQKFLEKQEKAITSFFDQKTPKDVIYKRKGRGNQNFDYVKGYWIVEQLNLLFSYMWSWEILRENVGQNQVWVLGTLMAYTPNGEIRKSAYGGSDIKKYADGRGVIDIADDLKAASMDGLKKAASLIGVAFDVYGGSDDNDDTKSIDPTKMRAFLFRASNLGMDERKLYLWVQEQQDINPDGLTLEDLSQVQQESMLRRLVEQDNKRKQSPTGTKSK